MLTTILSIYLLGLTAVPCVDGKTAHLSEKGSASEAVFSASEHDHLGEACTPFCSCQCCQIQLTVVGFPVFEPLNPTFQTVFDTSIHNLGNGFSNSLFQPPIV